MFETIQDIDFTVLDFIQDNLTCRFLDIVMPVITKLGSGGIVWIAACIIMLFSSKYRKCGIMMAMSLLLCLIVGNITLKPLIGRIRPFDMQTEIELLIKAPTDFSFPSGHTMTSFAAAIVIIYNNKKFGIPALILASLIAFSRLYLYVHYPSDILGGLIIAVIISFISIAITNILYKKYKLNKV